MFFFDYLFVIIALVGIIQAELLLSSPFLYFTIVNNTSVLYWYAIPSRCYGTGNSYLVQVPCRIVQYVLLGHGM